MWGNSGEFSEKILGISRENSGKSPEIVWDTRGAQHKNFQITFINKSSRKVPIRILYIVEILKYFRACCDRFLC